MRMHFLQYFIVFLFLHAICRLQCIDIGSDTAVARFNTQQTLNNGDTIAYFAALEKGFKINSLNGSITFDSIFPISGGDLRLNTAKIILNRDLVLRNTAKIASLGDIVGSSHTLNLSPNTISIPQNISSRDIVLATSIRLDSDPLSVDWSFDDQFIAIGLASGTNNELFVYKFDGTSLSLSSTIELPTSVVSVGWHPSDFILAIGVDNTASSAAELRLYTFDTINQTLTELAANAIDFGKDVSAVSWHSSGNFLAVGSFVNTSEINIYSYNQTNSILNTTPLTFVNLSPNQNIQKEAMDWDATGSYLAIGLSVHASADELQVFDFDEESLSLNASVNLGVNVRAVSWNPTTTNILAVGMETGSGNVLRIFEHDTGSGILTEKSSVNISTHVFNLQWNSLGDCLAIGLSASAGEQELRLYQFNKDTFGLTEVVNVEIGADVNALRWSHDGTFLSVGDNSDSMTIYGDISALKKAPCIWSNLNFVLNSNVKLTNCCIQFQGDSVINGRGYILTLDSTCTLQVAENSTLLLENIQLKNLNQFNLCCLDSLSTITFDTVTLILDGDYTFTQGHFDVEKDLHIVGDGFKFIYEADQASSILSHSSILLDQGVTFSYAPLNGSNNLLVFEDQTSKLILNNAGLHVVGTGLNLSNGTMHVRGSSFMESERLITNGRLVNNGITFGNSISSQDFNCIIEPNSQLSILQGAFIYKNMLLSSWNMSNNTSILFLEADAQLQIQENFDIHGGVLRCAKNAILVQSSAKSLKGTIEALGPILRFT